MDVAVRLPYIPPMWREGLAGIEAAALLRSGIWRGAGVAPGDGRPVEVPYTALYSRTDGIVDWRSCLDPHAELIEVRASHLGMGLNAEVYAELAHALGRSDDVSDFAQAA